MGFYRRFVLSLLLALSSLFAIVSLASAETKELDFLLDSNVSQSFETLIQQAQDLVKSSIEQEFAQNPEVSEVSILILGERNGQIVPILRSKVSRSQWQQDSRIHRWTRAFGSSGVLLGFYERSVSPTAQSAPQVNPTRFRARLREDPAFRDD